MAFSRSDSNQASELEQYRQVFNKREKDKLKKDYLPFNCSIGYQINQLNDSPPEYEYYKKIDIPSCISSYTVSNLHLSISWNLLVIFPAPMLKDNSTFLMFPPLSSCYFLQPSPTFSNVFSSVNVSVSASNTHFSHTWRSVAFNPTLHTPPSYYVSALCI